MGEREFDMPWFPFWASDFTNSRTVRTMTAEEVGVYVLLLASQWTDGPIPKNEKRWPGLTNGADVNTVGTVLERCFTSVPEGWVNERLEEIREGQVEKRMQKVRAGKASARARRRSAKSKEGNKKERRSNGVATGVPTEDQRRTNESESDTESDTEEKTTISGADAPSSDVENDPAEWMHELWHDHLGIEGYSIDLTPKRRQKYRAMFDEQLSEAPDPRAAWSAVLHAVTQSDHHMSERSYQMPESLLRSRERRETWVQRTVESLRNGAMSEADRRFEQRRRETLEYLELIDGGAA